MEITIKITFSSGKVIELTEAEYEEFRGYVPTDLFRYTDGTGDFFPLYPFHTLCSTKTGMKIEAVI